MFFNNKIKVLIVDDSAIVRKILSTELAKDPLIEVLGTAPDPFIARDKIMKLNPDVITLDIEMPKMDGLTFLKKIMKYKPTPVIIVSSTSTKGSDNAIKAFEYGAVDVLNKPGSAFSVGDMKDLLVEKIKIASRAKIQRQRKEEKIYEKSIDEDSSQRRLLIQDRTDVIAIGSSTGGTEAIKEILYRLPKNIPGIVIVQHMPPKFTKSFADRLNQECILDVKEAEDNDIIEPGKVIIAPGGIHMLVKKTPARSFVYLKHGPQVHHQRPAVDILFQSVADNFGQKAIGVILTGMGSDGASGMLKMHNKGAYTIAQDETTCVIYGMPGEAVKIGGVNKILPIHIIANHLVNYILR